MKKVLQNIKFNNYDIFLYDWMEYDTNPVPNVECYNENNELIWKISSITDNNKTDCWTDILNINSKLIAYNFMGFSCEIDPNTGKILSMEFVK